MKNGSSGAITKQSSWTRSAGRFQRSGGHGNFLASSPFYRVEYVLRLAYIVPRPRASNCWWSLAVLNSSIINSNPPARFPRTVLVIIIIIIPIIAGKEFFFPTNIRFCCLVQYSIHSSFQLRLQQCFSPISIAPFHNYDRNYLNRNKLLGRTVRYNSVETKWSCRSETIRGPSRQTTNNFLFFLEVSREIAEACALHMVRFVFFVFFFFFSFFSVFFFCSSVWYTE